MGEKVFRKVQFGLEADATPGTAVLATSMFLGTANVPVDRKPVYPEDTLGLRSRANRSVIYQIGVDKFTLKVEHGYFQALPFLLSTLLKECTPTETTPSQSDYLWAYTPSLTAANDPRTATIEVGDDTQAYEIEYCMGKSLKIEGKLGENAPVSLEQEFFGKQVTPTTFTVLSLPSGVEEMAANTAQIFIDSAWANLGGTEKTSLLREFSVEILTGNHPKYHGGELTMTGHGEGALDCMITFTFEGNSDADVLFDSFQAQTTKAIRLAVTGGQIGTGTNHGLIVDAFGTFEEVIPLGSEKDGDNLHTAVFHSINDGSGHQFAVSVTTNKSAE